MTPTSTRRETTPGRSVGIAAALDVAGVVLFVVIGRRSHDEGGNAVAEVAAIAGPFLLGLGAGWLVARAWRSPWSARTGLVVWAVTVVAGLLLRKLFGRDVPLSFCIVTAVFTALCLLGWRAIARRRVSAR